jgi:hypothetical protein
MVPELNAPIRTPSRCGAGDDRFVLDLPQAHLAGLMIGESIRFS